MAQIAEIIKYEGDNSTFIWKHPSEDFNSLTQLIVHESQEAIFFMNKAMYGLKAEYRQVLWLIYFEDMSIREAAVIMKKSVRSVENLVSRARSSLKSELDRTEYFYESL